MKSQAILFVPGHPPIPVAGAGRRNSNHNVSRQIPGHWPRAAAGNSGSNPSCRKAVTLFNQGRGQVLELPGKILMDEQDVHNQAGAL